MIFQTHILSYHIMEILEHAIKNQPGDIYHPPARFDLGSEARDITQSLGWWLAKKSLETAPIVPKLNRFTIPSVSIFPPGLPGVVCYCRVGGRGRKKEGIRLY